MKSVSSLLQLCGEAERLFGRPLLLPVDEEFVQSLHSPLGIERQNEETCNVSVLYRGLLERTRRRKSVEKVGIPKILFSYAAEAVICSRDGEFMGPLCSPLRKAHATMLRFNSYFVTEKSDGTRAILVSLLATPFPCWALCSVEDSVSWSLRLDDVVALEEMRQQLYGTNTTVSDDVRLRLSIGIFSVEGNREISSDGAMETFMLRRTADVCSGSLLRASVIKAERRVGGRHMAYCFDRSMEQAYLILEEYSVPSLTGFAIDGEMMIAVSSLDQEEARPLFGCFDVFRYTQLKDTLKQDVRLSRWSMSKRYEVLRNLIIGPMHVSQESFTTKSFLRVFCKEILPIEQFGECVSRLQPHAVDGPAGGVVYYYNGPSGLTKSDGFIFTPEKFDLVQGSSKDQLKWKWPSMLSVDWALTAIEGQKDKYVVDLFFRKKRFAHRPDSAGRSRLFASMQILNPLLFPISTTNSVIAECIFDRSLNCWSIERLRRDKSEPNSVVTIISVLESLVEDITLDVLVDMIGVKNNLPLDHIRFLQQNMHKQDGRGTIYTSEPQYEKKTCQFTLRATQLQTQGEHELHLYWAVRLLSEKQHIPCIHCKVSECSGLGFTCPVEDENSKLTEHLYIALANAGGSYAWSDFTVEAVFDGNAGRWSIVSLQPHGDNRRSKSVGVIQHLQWLLLNGREKAHIVASFATDLKEQSIVDKPTIALVEKTNNHYAGKTKQLSSGKDRSALRHFNNWVKNLLINNATSYVQLHRGNEYKRDGLAVADLCSGRGGDLFKWRRHRPKFLFMVDSCLEAVAEAAARYSISKGLSLKAVPQEKESPGVVAYFGVCDVFDEMGALTTKLEEFYDAHLKDKHFDIISCQFSLHYGCSTELRISTFLRIVSSALRPGGVFIGTTVNDIELLRRVVKHGPVFGNSSYTVKFSLDVPSVPSFGVEYFISVENTVSNLPEYMVPWERLVALCDSFGLQLVESFGFAEYRDMHYSTPLGQELRDIAVGSGKRDLDGHCLLPLSSEEMEVATLFRTFFFIKN